MDKVVKIKSKNKYGILNIESKPRDLFGHKRFNNIILEDGTIIMVRDDDLEVINDRAEEIIKED